jgi:hypothetical protein
MELRLNTAEGQEAREEERERIEDIISNEAYSD